MPVTIILYRKWATLQAELLAMFCGWVVPCGFVSSCNLAMLLTQAYL